MVYLIAIYGAIAFGWWAIRRAPALVKVLLETTFIVLLFYGVPIYAFAAGDWGYLFLAALMWVSQTMFMVLSLRPPRLEPIHDLDEFDVEIANAAAMGFTEVSAFDRQAPVPSGTMLWFTRPGETSVLRMVLSKKTNQLRLWSISSILGEAKGSLLTTPSKMGIFRFTEIRQIVLDDTDAWALHRDALAILAEHGIDTTQQVGENEQERLDWELGRDRQALRFLPITMLTMIGRVPFHIGPLRNRRGLHRQLRPFTHSADSR